MSLSIFLLYSTSIIISKHQLITVGTLCINANQDERLRNETTQHRRHLKTKG